MSDESKKPTWNRLSRRARATLIVLATIAAMLIIAEVVLGAIIEYRYLQSMRPSPLF